MKYIIESSTIESFKENVQELEKKFNERISDLAGVKGGMMARHVYCYYRSELWGLRNELLASLKEVKEETTTRKPKKEKITTSEPEINF